MGINQIYDVEIDTVNKPYLPIAAGELQPLLAWAFILLLAGSGLWIAATRFGSLISSLYALGLGLGTVYSVPPLRLKRFAVPAFLIIATVRVSLWPGQSGPPEWGRGGHEGVGADLPLGVQASMWVSNVSVQRTCAAQVCSAITKCKQPKVGIVGESARVFGRGWAKCEGRLGMISAAE